MNRNACSWMSLQWGECEPPATLRDLLAQVPYVELTATTTFQVR